MDPRKGLRSRPWRVVSRIVLVAAGGITSEMASERTLFDPNEPGASDRWVPVNDVVMGGVSTGALEVVGGTAVFSGVVSLENNGGFASVRSIPQRVDLSGSSGIALRVRGDGRRYKLNVKTDRSLDGVLYRAAFETRSGEWQTVRLPFSGFEPTFRGRGVPNADPLDLTRVTSLGLMISDKQVGPFRLEIEWIQAFVD